MQNHKLIFALIFLTLSILPFLPPTSLAGTPIITNLSDKILHADSAAEIFDNDITFTNGINYTDGFLRFTLTGATASDQFLLTNDIDVNASGAISLIGLNVYLGNGSGRDRIGSIDATENGQNGQSLKVLFSSPIVNAGFETGDLTGWTYYDQQFTGNSQGQAIPYSYSCSPTCTTGTGALNFPSGISPADNSAYSYELSTATVYSGTYSLRLYLSGNVTDEYSSANTGFSGTQPTGYASWHGPYVESTPFEAENGDSIYMEWSAQNGGDWYEVFGYIVGSGGDGIFGNGNDTSTLLFSQRGDSQSWVTSNSSINASDTYIFRFVGGTYDASGGLAVGGSLYMDNLRIVGSTSVNDATVTSIARNVSYDNSGDISSTARTLTVDTQAFDGSIQSDTATLTIRASEPAVQASGINISQTGIDAIMVNWTSGAGTSRLVVMKSGTSVDASVTDGTDYTAIPVYGNGSQIGSGNFTVYNGSGNSVAVTGLTMGSTYHVAVYEFNGSNDLVNYMTPSPATGAITINKVGATVTLANLNHDYDGTQKNATATTSPQGLSVDLTYGGSPIAPNNVGGYTVVGTVNDANYQGNASESLTISPVLPTVSTAPATNVSSAAALSGGDVTFDGGVSVTVRGVCWNTSGSPTKADTCTTDGSGSGTFTSLISGLSPATVYYVRAYAENSVGPAYGNQISPTTVEVRSLSVIKEGRGKGTVTSAPAGIDCGTDCDELYEDFTPITMVATPGANSKFTGWSGDADCVDGIITMTSDISCTANFYRFPWLILQPALDFNGMNYDAN